MQTYTRSISALSVCLSQSVVPIKLVNFSLDPDTELEPETSKLY